MLIVFGRRDPQGGLICAAAATVVGTIATNKDIHPGVLRNMAAGSMEAASAP